MSSRARKKLARQNRASQTNNVVAVGGQGGQPAGRSSPAQSKRTKQMILWGSFIAVVAMVTYAVMRPNRPAPDGASKLVSPTNSAQAPGIPPLAPVPVVTNPVPTGTKPAGPSIQF